MIGRALFNIASRAVGEARALFSLVYEVGQILFLRRDGEAQQPSTGELTPVVRVPPTAASMVARAAPPRSKARPEDELLEGSLEARRNRAMWE